MKQYLLDEIPRDDIARVREYLNQHAVAAGIADIWWVDLKEDLLSSEQFDHRIAGHTASRWRSGIISCASSS